MSFVVSLLATRKNTDYASESVALPSLPSDCTSDIGNGLPWRRFSASSRVAERDLVPDHLFGCADANLSKNTMLQAGSPYTWQRYEVRIDSEATDSKLPRDHDLF